MAINWNFECEWRNRMLLSSPEKYIGFIIIRRTNRYQGSSSNFATFHLIWNLNVRWTVYCLRKRVFLAQFSKITTNFISVITKVLHCFPSFFIIVSQINVNFWNFFSKSLHYFFLTHHLKCPGNVLENSIWYILKTRKKASTGKTSMTK